MCEHQPRCPEARAVDRQAARVVVAHPEQGWSLLCNGVVLFEDTGEIVLSGRDGDGRAGDGGSGAGWARVPARPVGGGRTGSCPGRVQRLYQPAGRTRYRAAP